MRPTVASDSGHERVRQRRAVDGRWDALTVSLVDVAARDWLHFCAARRSVLTRSFFGRLLGMPQSPVSGAWTSWQAFQLAWFEVFLGDRWYTFDARHNTPRIGRVVMARGRDAGDVPITMAFGPNTLQKFDVTTYEVDVYGNAIFTV